jgi:hypothetical protein
MLVAGLQPGTKADVWRISLAPSKQGKKQNRAFVKLLETMAGPSGNQVF